MSDEGDGHVVMVLVEAVTLLHELCGLEAAEDEGHLRTPGWPGEIGLFVVPEEAEDLEEDDDGCSLDCFFDLLDEASVGARRGIVVRSAVVTTCPKSEKK